MNIEIDQVSFIFSREEFAALLQLTGCDGLPCFPAPEKDELERGLASLEEALLVSRSDDTLTLDSISAFLAKTAGESDCFTGYTNGTEYCGVFNGEGTAVVLRLQQGRWIATAWPRWVQALEMYLDADVQAAVGEVFFGCRQGLWHRPFSTKGDAKLLLREAAEHTQAGLPPEGEELTLWKQ